MSVTEPEGTSNSKANGPVIDRSRYVRRPAAVALSAFAIGIWVDRTFPVDWPVWLGLSTLVLGLTLLLRRSLEGMPRLSAGVCLLCLLPAGGLRHHLFWSVRAADEIAAFCRETPCPVRIRGVIATPIETLQAKHGPRIPAWMEIDRSTCDFLCRELLVDERWEPVSGALSMTVDGHLVHVGVGDRVEVLGFLSVPAAPRNPGEQDVRRSLRNRGLCGLLQVDHPQAVTRMERLHHVYWMAARLRERIRRIAQQQICQGLSPATRGIAGSLLLGDRSLMTDDLREHFVESGTMHLLAISGLHVGILLGMAAICCKLLNLSNRQMAWVLVLAALGYAALTNHRPPVLRATLLATLALLGGLRGRSLDGINLLGVTGLALLLWNPGDLFDVGARLSFLAAASIFWGMKAWPATNRFVEPDPLAPERSRLVAALHTSARDLGSAYLITGSIWLVTTPVTVTTFHVLAPVGVLLNVALIPFTAVILGLGYLFLFSALILPVASPAFAWLFDAALGGFLAVVKLGQATPLSHRYLPDLPDWWIIGFHLLIAGIWFSWGIVPHVRWTFHALLAWIAIGLGAGAFPDHRPAFRCTFLAMGHGLSTVIELPNGQNLLYDAGTIGDGTRAERIIERALWSRGITHLDAILISHADHDHFSGIFGLLEKFSIGTILVGQATLDPQQRNVAELAERAARFGVPIRVVQAGDRLLTGGHRDELSLQLLHPAGGFRSRSDNANSLVLEILIQGKRILLTGDLERDGLTPVLHQPARHCDVLLAPHHGGKAANVPELYAWATPDYVVVSSRGEETNPELVKLVGSAELLITDSSGAITFLLDRQGNLIVEEFRRRSGR